MGSAAKRPTILVVEDEMIVARDIQLQLEVLGYQPVGHATQGEQAVALCAALRPDLVLMDIQLKGGMDGIAAAQAIRTQFALPVVFLTAFASDDILARAKLTSPYGYIFKPFAERELRTVIEMALYKHQTEVKLRELSAHQVNIREDERKQIAREIHDDLGGLLTGIKSYLSVLIGRALRSDEPVDQVLLGASRMADLAIDTVRRIITELRPSVLDQLGVWAALEWHASQVEERTALRCECLIDESLTNIELDADTSIAVFRIVQQLFANVIQHAEATVVEVRAVREGRWIRIEVEDNGKGIEPAQLLGEKSWGIIGMYERALQCRGELRIDGTPRRGTLAVLRLPVR
jgi:signal transduction histidine kinase